MADQNYDMNALLYALHFFAHHHKDLAERSKYRILLKMAYRAQGSYSDMLAEAEKRQLQLPDLNTDWLSQVEPDGAPSAADDAAFLRMLGQRDETDAAT